MSDRDTLRALEGCCHWIDGGGAVRMGPRRCYICAKRKEKDQVYVPMAPLYNQFPSASVCPTCCGKIFPGRTDADVRRLIRLAHFALETDCLAGAYLHTEDLGVVPALGEGVAVTKLGVVLTEDRLDRTLAFEITHTDGKKGLLHARDVALGARGQIGDALDRVPYSDRAKRVVLRRWEGYSVDNRG